MLFLFFLLLIGAEHLVDHVAEGDGGVGHLLIGPLLEEGLVVLQVIVIAAKGDEGLKAGVALAPLDEAMTYEVVFVVFE